MAVSAEQLSTRKRTLPRFGDVVLHGLTGLVSLGAVVLLGALIYKIFQGAHLAISTFGLSFLSGKVWDPVHNVFGALPFIYGTAMTSLIALLLATPLAIAIALFLTEMAPRAIRGTISALVEMLAAIPSVILGLWGIFVLAPVMRSTIEPALKSTLGWLPIFGGQIPSSGAGILTAGVILTIMVVPIIASVARELFLAVPRDLQEGAFALGTTRWEMVRGVVLPYTRAGLVAATILGLARALGEAIAVTQVIGGTPQITRSLFEPGDSMASKLASQYLNAVTKLEVSSLFYLAAILLVIGLGTNLLARLIVSRFDVQARGAH
jgi:phosphate transport system permease protein